MSTTSQTDATDRTDAARHLQSCFVATRVSFTWFGVKRSLSADQKAEAAGTFGADAKFLSASKKLLDTQAPAYKAVSTIRSRILRRWKENTLDFPEDGVRLLREGDLDQFNADMEADRDSLRLAVEDLNAAYRDLVRAARVRLGDLFNADDYPANLDDQFAVTWDFPTVEPPEYLRLRHPDLYAREQQRVAAQFDQAVRLAEDAFAAELLTLVEHLGRKLSGLDDGQAKRLHDSAVENIREFFERFQRMNVRSNQQLDQLVERARGIVADVRPDWLRESSDLRQAVAQQLAPVQAALDGLLVDRPRRNIQRQPKASE